MGYILGGENFYERKACIFILIPIILVGLDETGHNDEKDASEHADSSG